MSNVVLTRAIETVMATSSVKPPAPFQSLHLAKSALLLDGYGTRVYQTGTSASAFKVSARIQLYPLVEAGYATRAE